MPAYPLDDAKKRLFGIASATAAVLVVGWWAWKRATGTIEPVAPEDAPAGTSGVAAVAVDERGESKNAEGKVRAEAALEEATEATESSSEVSSMADSTVVPVKSKAPLVFLPFDPARLIFLFSNRGPGYEQPTWADIASNACAQLQEGNREAGTALADEALVEAQKGKEVGPRCATMMVTTLFHMVNQKAKEAIGVSNEVIALWMATPAGDLGMSETQKSLWLVDLMVTNAVFTASTENYEGACSVFESAYTLLVENRGGDEEIAEQVEHSQVMDHLQIIMIWSRLSRMDEQPARAAHILLSSLVLITNPIDEAVFGSIAAGFLVIASKYKEAVTLLTERVIHVLEELPNEPQTTRVLVDSYCTLNRAYGGLEETSLAEEALSRANALRN